jgi:DNA-binding transcriptional regulator YiaG
MSATITASTDAASLVPPFIVDETPVGKRWRGVILGMSLVAASALSTTTLARAREVADSSSTPSAGSTGLVSWDVELTRSSEATATIPPRAAEALEAVERLRATLALSEERVAELAGIARGSIRNWRTGAATPYPATVRRLFEIDSVLLAARAALGDRLSLWLLAPREGEPAPLEVLQLPDGPSRVAREASAMIFKPAQSSRLPTLTEIADDSDDAEVIEHPPTGRPFAGLAKPRRARS